MKKLKNNKLFKKRQYFFRFLVLSSAPILLSTVVASCMPSPDKKNQNSNIDTNLSSIDQKIASNIIKNPNFFQNEILDLSSFQNLKEIGNNSFSDISIRKIIFPNNLKIIGAKAFFNTKNISDLILPKSLVEIKSNAFDNSGIKGINLTENLNLKNIEKSAFDNNEELKITIKHDWLKVLLKNSGIKDDQIIYQSDSNPIDQNKPNEPKKPNNEINRSGLLTDKVLQTDSYLPVVETLELNNLSTKLSNLTNEKLNNLLHKNPLFSNLNLSITDGSSELIGTLKLNLTGSYNGKDIPKNTIIVVSNFFTYSNFNNFYLDFFKIDNNLYFKDLQTNDSLNKWNTKEWIKYALSLNIVAKNNSTSASSKIIDLKNSRFLDDFNLNFQYQSNSKKVQISGDISQKEFNENSWNQVDNRKIIQVNKNNNNSLIDVQFPNKNDAINYVINNQITLNSEDPSFKQNQELYYPSEFEQKFGSMLNGKGLEKLLLIFPELYSEYLKNNYDLKKPEIKINGLYPDDFGGRILFNYSFYDSAYSDSLQLASKSLKIEGFKQINDFLKMNSDFKNNSFVIPGRVSGSNGDYKNTSIWEYAKSEILKNYSLEDLKNLSSSPQTLNNSNPIFWRSGNGKTINLIRSNSENKFDRSSFESYDKYFQFKLFNSLIKDKFDFDTGLFNVTTNKENNKFKIYSLHAKILDQTKANILKSSNSYYYGVDFVYEIEFANANSLSQNTKMVTINAKYLVHFLSSDLGIN